MLATPGLTANPYAIGAPTLIGGVGSGMWNVIVVSLRQRITPDRLLGRVTASGRLLGWGTPPLGAALGGAIASVADVQAVFLSPRSAAPLSLCRSYATSPRRRSRGLTRRLGRSPRRIVRTFVRLDQAQRGDGPRPRVRGASRIIPTHQQATSSGSYREGHLLLSLGSPLDARGSVRGSGLTTS